MNNQMVGNLLAAMMQIMRSGGNPMYLLQQMAAQDPQVSQAMRMIQGKSPQQLRSMAENMAKERGVSLESMANQMGITLPNSQKS